MFRPVAIACAAFALSACATPAPPDGRDCFLNRQITGYSVIDEHHVRVSVGAGRRYILTTNWNAHDLRWTEAIAIRSTGDWICTGNGLGVDVIGGTPRQTYPIVSIEREPEPPPEQPQGS
jgi:hypothetical protein